MAGIDGKKTKSLLQDVVYKVLASRGVTKTEALQFIYRGFLVKRFSQNRPQNGECSQLYAISDGMGRVKIGSSTSPDKRVRTLQIGSPVVYTLVGHTDCFQGLEYAVHKHLEKHRIRGEWFHEKGEVLSIVKAIKARETLGLCDRIGAFACLMGMDEGMEDDFEDFLQRCCDRQVLRYGPERLLIHL
jgi:hypothetical protein